MCSFTGYRPGKLPFLNNRQDERYVFLYNALREEIIRLAKKGVVNFQTGMARGIDLMCGEIVLELQQTMNVRLFCAIPCRNQCYGWRAAEVAVYKRILAGAAGVVYVSPNDYADGCMQKRNRYLVDTAQYVIAVYDGQRGGTMSTVNYAKRKQRTVIIINPTDFTRIELLHSNEEGVLYV